MTIVGIDCATVPEKIGVARASLVNGSAVVEEVRCGSSSLVDLLAEWIVGGGASLIALDAPLGWPAGLGSALIAHEAGRSLPDGPLFNRQTDRLLRERLGQRPLDVGADRIARTARSTLQLLEELRRATGSAIPLAWSPDVTGIQAIEVYPAGTLRAHGLSYRQYKRRDQAAQRETILEGLGARLSLESISDRTLNADEIDALVCVLAAVDFLSGSAIAPEDTVTASKEGWIWVRAASISQPAG